ncbi:hypothetical protein ASD81_16130 [Nocardioides sp. Root614]|nr:hypothetical protein ASD81_16130 [Nocardioides sp. Root614]KRA87645.1 hypothetical protein ASD84_16405 [Nocardioides sp. Root682]
MLAALGAGGASVLASGARGHASATVTPFLHGVSSGDPRPDRVVIWTRVTVSPDAHPGSGIGAAVSVTWEVSQDCDFRRLVKTGTAVTGSATDHTIKVDVRGLEPGQRYYYRFLALGSASPTGATRSAAARDSVRPVRFGVVSCAHHEWGHFAAYRHLAGMELDAVLHLGDYIYEYPRDAVVAGVSSPLKSRGHLPIHETVTLQDYRMRHGQYRLDANLQAMHAKHAVIAIWDDHEIANDAWREGAENHGPGEGDFPARVNAARQAWLEWLPVRPDPHDPAERIHRKFEFGRLVDLWMLDERSYRDEQPASALLGYVSVDRAVTDPDRTMLGRSQRDWLVGGVRSSTATWQVLGNQVPFFPLQVGPALPGQVAALLKPLAGNIPLAVPPALYVDDWNGYQAERQHLAKAFEGEANVVVLTGDVHETFVCDIPKDAGSYLLTRASNAVEFIVPGVSSPSIARGLNTVATPVGNLVDTILETNLALGSPWVKYHEGFANGFGVVDFTESRVHCDMWHLDDVTDPRSGARVAVSYASRRGTRRAVRVQAAL